ncbi:PTS fructose transporter subunit IIC [Clostridium akagii]|uniref:PTS fructose transporter subunit IIC n=1 Tax=Clostridium akagii TaxID=91623 RepID=UPI00047B436E|nr:fructose-specific PTS transporter subunit EIIC [Clostridium akagii]
MKKLVAVTSCPTGIAHTYMAAEALQMAAKEMGYEIKVETQGSVGAENILTDEDVAAADAVIIAADTNVDKARFAGKPLLEVPVKDAIKDSKGLIEKALQEKAEPKSDSSMPVVKKKERTGIYKHLMTGVSFMIPFVAAGGLLIALGFALGGIYVFDCPGTFAEALFVTGKGAFALMLPILSGYIAYSIADRPGLVAGFIGGALSSGAIASGQFLAHPLATGTSGFLGALLFGFAAGYIVLGIKKFIKLPKTLEGLMPVLIIPVLSSAIIGLLYMFVFGGPLVAINTGLLSWLKSLQGTNAALLGLILGLMMAFDMGGPVNKAAYIFGTGTIVAGGSSIMAAVMVAGMIPPLGIALASTVLAKKKFTEPEREAGKAAWALGASFITEGAIPFAAGDPLRVIPACMAGAGVAGALSMMFGVRLAVPHGGLWVVAIPNVVSNLALYLVAMVVGTIITGVILSIVKKDLSAE